jgi:hypothetical protein
LPCTLTDPAHSTELSHSTLLRPHPRLPHFRSLCGTDIADTPHAPPCAAGARVCCGRSRPPRSATSAVPHWDYFDDACSCRRLCLLLDPSVDPLPFSTPNAASYSLVHCRPCAPSAATPTPAASFSSRARPNPSACGQARMVFGEGTRRQCGLLREGRIYNGQGCKGRRRNEMENDTKISVACRAGSRVHNPCPGCALFLSTIQLSLSRFHFLRDSPRIDVRDAWPPWIDSPLPPSLPPVLLLTAASGDFISKCTALRLASSFPPLPFCSLGSRHDSLEEAGHAHTDSFFSILSHIASQPYVRIQM